VALRGLDEPRLLCSGPARLAQALAIGREQNGSPVWEPPLVILSRGGAAGEPHADPPRIETTPRIGVRGGDQKPWRFVDADSRFLSRPLPRSVSGGAGMARVGKNQQLRQTKGPS
jgi:DNA-3-methyladenine glycosylase